MRRRIWSEMLPLRELMKQLKPLRHREIELTAAIRGDELREAPDLLRACADEGVRCALWPMLPDHEGRWPSCANVRSFADYTERLLDLVPSSVAPPDVAFDLEPPIGLVSRWLSSRTTTRAPGADEGRWDEAIARFGALAARVRAGGAEAIAAVVPMCLYDPPGKTGSWQRAMGTPVDEVAWDRTTTMLYTTMFEGWSLGALSREDARHMLVDGCRRVRARYGARGGVSLGAVDTGALGDEPVYRAPHELREDVSICVAEGITELTLFDYAGVLRRGPADRWLDAFTSPDPEPASPRGSLRARAVLGAASALGRAPIWTRR